MIEKLSPGSFLGRTQNHHTVAGIVILESVYSDELCIPLESIRPTWRACSAIDSAAASETNSASCGSNSPVDAWRRPMIPWRKSPSPPAFRTKAISRAPSNAGWEYRPPDSGNRSARAHRLPGNARILQELESGLAVELTLVTGVAKSRADPPRSAPLSTRRTHPWNAQSPAFGTYNRIRGLRHAWPRFT